MLGTRVISLAATALVLQSCAASPSLAADPGKKIVVVFRYDDYSSRSSTTEERALIAEFVKRRKPVTIGVVPRECLFARVKRDGQPEIPLQPEKVRMLLAAGGYVDVALHGYTHQWLNPSEQSEFAGMSLADQKERIGKGKRELERQLGRKITTFIPPWNSYDGNTVKALAELGFTCLSAGLYGSAYLTTPRVKYLPSTCEPHELQDTVQEARRLGRPGIAIVVLIHDRDFVESNRWAALTLDEFADILDWTARQSDLSVLSISGAAASVDDLGAERLQAVEHYVRQPFVIPGFLRVKDRKLYMTASDARRDVCRSEALTVVYFAGIAVFGFVLALATGIVLWRFGVRRTYIVAGITALVVFVAYFLIHHQVGRLYAAVASAGCGAYLGAWGFIIGPRKKSRR